VQAPHDPGQYSPAAQALFDNAMSQLSPVDAYKQADCADSDARPAITQQAAAARVHAHLEAFLEHSAAEARAAAARAEDPCLHNEDIVPERAMAAAAVAWCKGRAQRAMRLWRLAVVAAQHAEDATAAHGATMLLRTLLLYAVRGRDLFTKEWVRVALLHVHSSASCARAVPRTHRRCCWRSAVPDCSRSQCAACWRLLTDRASCRICLNNSQQQSFADEL
jgi:hypothetical protein